MKHLVVIGAVAAMLAASAQSSALGAAGCERVTGSGQTQLGPSGAFEGTGTFVIGGVEQTVASSTVIRSSEERGGVTFAVTSHTFTLADGTVVVTVDKARMIPLPEPGLYRLVSFLRIESGATGFLAGRGGTLDFRGLPRATWEISSGQICGLP